MTQNSLPIREHMETAFHASSSDYYTPGMLRVYADFVLEGVGLDHAKAEVQKFYVEKGFSYDGKTYFKKGDESHSVTVSRFGSSVIITAAEI